MSQHQIQVDSPKVGRVLVTVGYDPVLDEAFFNFFNERKSFMSPDGLSVAEVAELAARELGLSLPQQVIEGMQKDVADYRLGAKDLGRRFTRYEPDGAVAEAVKW